MTRTVCAIDLIKTVHSFNLQSGTGVGSLTQQKLYYILGFALLREGFQYTCVFTV